MLQRSKIREYWERYVFNVGCDGVRHLSDVYQKFSGTKKEIWEQIATDCTDKHGFKLSIISFSQKYFTAGFMYKDGDKLIFKVYIPSGEGIMELGQNEKHDAVMHKVL